MMCDSTVKVAFITIFKPDLTYSGRVLIHAFQKFPILFSSKTKYLGTTVNRDNLIEEEIKERIAAGNRASFANQKILQSKLISKETKMKLYKALIRPVAVYGSECWVLTENIKQKLLVFERKILRRIFGPTQKANGVETQNR